VAGAVHEGDVAGEVHGGATDLAGRVVFLHAAVGPEALRPRTAGALEDLGVGVAQFDGDVALQLVFETHRLHAGDGLDDGGFSVRHMANCSWIFEAPKTYCG